MKKPQIPPLVLLICVFAAFIAGLFFGRSLNRAPVRISYPPAATQAAITPSVPDETSFSGIVNINTAPLEQLTTLPGIGPVLAQRIIDYREEYGDFQSPEELTKVEGIGAGRLEDIWDLITTGGSA